MNVDLKVRQIAAMVQGAPGVDHIFSDSTLHALGFDDDSHLVFWREVEHEFEIAVTRAQRANLSTIGQIVHYLKSRTRKVG
jgi:hypothetical protein